MLLNEKETAALKREILAARLPNSRVRVIAWSLRFLALFFCLAILTMIGIDYRRNGITQVFYLGLLFAGSWLLIALGAQLQWRRTQERSLLQQLLKTQPPVPPAEQQDE